MAVEILEIPEVRQRVSPLSVEEYHRLDEFNEHGKRTELIRGVVIEKMSKSPLHSALGKRLYDLIAQTLPKDRKSTRLNSSHLVISYAVFCLKKKNQKRYFTRAIRYVPLMEHNRRRSIDYQGIATTSLYLTLRPDRMLHPPSS